MCCHAFPAYLTSGPSPPAQVLLDKHPHIRTVVNKVGTIDTQFRFFNMELLAGEDSTVATVRENGCSFTFDFAKVYWNSRLHTEHERLVSLLGSGQAVVDMFAGVGPFAIPAAKKGCVVLANDLNPEAHRCLLQNARSNRVDQQLRGFNMDAREFVKKAFSLLVEESIQSDHGLPLAKGSHVVLNLPGSAVDFLGSLRGVLSLLPLVLRPIVPLPQIHCYAFTKSDCPAEDVQQQVERKVGVALPAAALSVTRVRDVAPNKLMMRASFELPRSVSYAVDAAAGGPPPPSISHTCNCPCSLYIRIFMCYECVYIMNSIILSCADAVNFQKRGSAHSDPMPGAKKQKLQIDIDTKRVKKAK